MSVNNSSAANVPSANLRGQKRNASVSETPQSSPTPSKLAVIENDKNEVVVSRFNSLSYVLWFIVWWTNFQNIW